jgi:phospholipid N-methyltransferase
MLKDFRVFYSEFLQNFSSIGAIAPSSRLLGKAMTRPLRQRPAGSIRVLEVGAGTGTFTRRILRHLGSGDQLDIYELNPRFYLFLRKHLPLAECVARGIECRLINRDVRTLTGEAPYDYIICGLPFNNFQPEVVSEILTGLIHRLSPEGVLSYFEYIFSHEFKARFLKPSERNRMIQVGVTVRGFVQKHQFAHHQVWLNLPPARARYCRRVASQASHAVDHRFEH